MSDYILHNGELYHYGVLGMKWGKHKAKGIVGNDKPKRRFPVLDESQPKPKHMPPVLDEKSKKVGKGITEQIGDGIKNKIAEKKAQAKAAYEKRVKEIGDNTEKKLESIERKLNSDFVDGHDAQLKFIEWEDEHSKIMDEDRSALKTAKSDYKKVVSNIKAEAKAEKKAVQKEANDKYNKAYDDAISAQEKAESYKEGSKEHAQAQKVADMKWSQAKELYKNTSYKKGRDAAVAVAATAIAGITIAALYKKSKSVKEGKRYIDAVWREIK